MSGQPNESAGLAREKSPLYPLTRGMGGPQSRYGHFGAEENPASVYLYKFQHISAVFLCVYMSWNWPIPSTRNRTQCTEGGCHFFEFILKHNVPYG